MNETIIPVPLSRVRKMEFPELVKGFLEVLDKYGPSDHFVQGIYNLLLAKEPQLASLIKKISKLEETDELDALHTRRRGLFKAILKQKDAMTDAKIASLEVQRALILPFLNEFFAGILRDTTVTQTTRVKQMTVSLDTKADLKAALTVAGVTPYIEELKGTQLLINAKNKEKRASVSKLPKMKTKMVKSDLGTSINDLIKAIELARKEHPEVDYAPMVNEINALLMPFHVKIKSMSTRRKTASIEATEAEAESIVADDKLKSA